MVSEGRFYGVCVCGGGGGGERVGLDHLPCNLMELALT